jgi:hypothetical protein
LYTFVLIGNSPVYAEMCPFFQSSELSGHMDDVKRKAYRWHSDIRWEKIKRSSNFAKVYNLLEHSRTNFSYEDK